MTRGQHNKRWGETRNEACGGRHVPAADDDDDDKCTEQTALPPLLSE